MKYISVFFLFIIPMALHASSNIIIEGIDPSDIVQTLDFKGPSEYRTTAAIVKRKDENGYNNVNLLILSTDKKTGKTSIVVENPDVGLNDGSGMIEQSQLATNKNGSLQIINKNSSVGRDRYEETLTIVYRDNTYIVAGITIYYNDTAVLSEENCDYNLLSGKTINSYSLEGKVIKNNINRYVLPQKIELKNFNTSTKLNACKFI